METEKLENTANEALRLIIDNAAAAKDFVLAELPDVVKQLLMWKMAEALMYIIIFGILFLSLVALTVFIAKATEWD